MATSLPLSETGSVTLDGTGKGTVRMRPPSAREHWLPTLASVSVSSSNNEAQCRIYVGGAAIQASFVDGTLSGSTGDSTDRVSGYDVNASQQPYIFAVWTGGDPGAQATLVLAGTKEIR